MQRVFFKFSHHLTSCQLFTVLIMFKEWWRLRRGGEHLRQWNFKILLRLLPQCQLFNILLICFFYQWRLKKATKKVSYTCTADSTSVFGPFSVPDRKWKRKKKKRSAIIWKRISVDRWKSSKMQDWWGKYFSWFSSKWKRGLSKSHQCGQGFTLATNPGIPFD